MKLILHMSFVFVCSVNSFARTLSCKANGNTFGVVKINALESNGQIYSQVIIRNSNTDIPLPVFISKASLGSFQIAPSFYSGPAGIKNTFLMKTTSNSYILNTKTFCNFYYQEETCLDGDLIAESNDLNITCKVEG